MSQTVIYFDGGGGGIRAAASINGTQTAHKDFTGITPGEGSLIDYLANVVIGLQMNLKVKFQEQCWLLLPCPLIPRVTKELLT